MSTRTRTLSPGYSTVHHWIHQDRGLASDHLCVAHPDYPYPHWAEQWAYNGLGGENERTGISHSRGRYHYEYSYSVDTNDYMPLCREAHNRLDAEHRKAALREQEDDAGIWLL